MITQLRKMPFGPGMVSCAKRAMRLAMATVGLSPDPKNGTLVVASLCRTSWQSKFRSIRDMALLLGLVGAGCAADVLFKDRDAEYATPGCNRYRPRPASCSQR